MIYYRFGSLFASSAQVLVNPVNCVGVMGAGLAAEFKARMPAGYFQHYRQACAAGKFACGVPLLWWYDEGHSRGVIDFPTKFYWNQPSPLTYVDAGLERLAGSLASKGIRSVAFPKLGCGLGGLDWSEVGPLFRHYFGAGLLPIEIYIGRGDQQY